MPDDTTIEFTAGNELVQRKACAIDSAKRFCCSGENFCFSGFRGIGFTCTAGAFGNLNPPRMFTGGGRSDQGGVDPISVVLSVQSRDEFGVERNPVVDFGRVWAGDLAPGSVRLDPCF